MIDLIISNYRSRMRSNNEMSLTRLGRVATAALVGSHTYFRMRVSIMEHKIQHKETHAILIRVLTTGFHYTIFICASCQRADAVKLGTCTRSVIWPERIFGCGRNLEIRYGEL